MLNDFTFRFLCRAYALGYYHGRALGVSDNAYARDDARVAYDQGYESGVADYCAEDTGEDEEYGDDMDGDHASALASAGWGTDEDYGSAGDSY